MAKFLSDSDFAEIRTAINDTVETFAQKPVLYKLTTEQAMDRFGRDKHLANNKTKFDLLGLVVWSVPDSELNVEDIGKYDFSMGYVLFSWDYLVEKELIITGTDESNNPTSIPAFKPEVDLIVIEGETLEVMGVNIAGQLKDKECVVKVFFKRDLKNGR